MSIAAMQWAFEVQGFNGHKLNVSDKCVLIILADHANERHECYPSIARIAKRTSLSPRAVQATLRRLEGCGLVLCLTPGGGRDRNTYRLAFGAGVAVEATPAASAPVQDLHGNPMQDLHGSSRNESVNPMQDLHPTPADPAPKPLETPIPNGKDISRKREGVQGEGAAAAASAAPSRATKPRGGRKAKAAEKGWSTIGIDWQPDEGMRRYAESKGLDPDGLRDDFVAWYVNAPEIQGRGINRHWNLVWAKWCRKQIERAATNVVTLRPSHQKAYRPQSARDRRVSGADYASGEFDIPE